VEAVSAVSFVLPEPDAQPGFPLTAEQFGDLVQARYLEGRLTLRDTAEDVVRKVREDGFTVTDEIAAGAERTFVWAVQSVIEPAGIVYAVQVCSGTVAGCTDVPSSDMDDERSRVHVASMLSWPLKRLGSLRRARPTDEDRGLRFRLWRFSPGEGDRATLERFGVDQGTWLFVAKTRSRRRA
jgi:hypothetical protein